MRHRLLAALALLTVAMGPLLAQDARNQAWQLLRSGQELTRAGRYDEAEKAILQARDLDPKYPEVYANLPSAHLGGWRLHGRPLSSEQHRGGPGGRRS